MGSDLCNTRGTLPHGGVGTLSKPLFHKDLSGLAWCTCLAYGSELRLLTLDFPTGFEWHLGLLELLTFSICWRFQGSIYMACGVAFVVNQAPSEGGLQKVQRRGWSRGGECQEASWPLSSPLLTTPCVALLGPLYRARGA